MPGKEEDEDENEDEQPGVSRVRAARVLPPKPKVKVSLKTLPDIIPFFNFRHHLRESKSKRKLAKTSMIPYKPLPQDCKSLKRAPSLIAR